MKKNNFKRHLRKCLLLPLVCMFFGSVTAQDLYIDDGGKFYLGADNDFTTSGTVITHHANGEFILEAGSTWTTATEYVNGKITVIGAGTTTVNIGDAGQSTVTITTVAGDEIVCDYTKTDPAVTGFLDAGLISSNFGLSDTEFWTVTSNAGPSTDVTVAGLTQDGSAVYDGLDPLAVTPIIVRYNGSNWVDYSGSTGFGDFSLAVDKTTLGTNAFNVENFSFYPNPVKANATSINFYLPNTVNQLDVTMYDYTGKTVQQYNNVSIQTGVNSIDKPNVAEGLYLLQFSFNNGEQQVTKKVLIE